ncbi:MAG: hypothetical protein AAFZ63_16395 [Bacteroidota bacterium]
MKNLVIYFSILFLTIGYAKTQSIPIDSYKRAVKNAIYEFRSSKTARFPAEYGTWTAFIEREMIYPDSALEKGYSRDVTAKYQVQEDGSLVFIKMWKQEDKLYEEEIRRVVALMPKWIPARRDGIAIKKTIGLTFSFYLSSDYLPSKENDDLSDDIILKPDIKASFPGGWKARKEFIIKQRGHNNAADGFLIILFVCEKDGTITFPEVVGGGGAVRKNQADPIIAAMPKWNPVIHNGKPVRSQIYLPIWF